MDNSATELLVSKSHKTPSRTQGTTASSSSSTAGSTNQARDTEPVVAGPDSALGGGLDVPGASVVESTEAGGYYCEHTLFGALDAAAGEGSSVISGDGGPLAGFLHLPDDAATYSTDQVVDQAGRHEETRRVVGAALRGYFDQISLRGGVADGEPFRILISGYGSFLDSIRNNPTGDFVLHVENLTAAMQLAFGASLVGGPEQVDVERTDRFLQEAVATGGVNVDEYYTATWRFQVLEPATCDARDVLVTALQLPVTDQAIDPSSPGSIQDAMDEFGPQAVLSMGVVPDEDFSEHTYRVETRADDQNLRVEQNRMSHQQNLEPTREFESRGLSNAIRDGAGSLSATPSTRPSP